MAKYQDRRDEVTSKAKDKQHKQAIAIADSIFNKKSTYEQEIKRLQQ